MSRKLLSVATLIGLLTVVGIAVGSLLPAGVGDVIGILGAIPLSVLILWRAVIWVRT
jgi:hypothetical protein